MSKRPGSMPVGVYAQRHPAPLPWHRSHWNPMNVRHLLAAAALMATAAVQAAPHYQVIDLGTGWAPAGFNQAGQVVGTSTGRRTEAVLYANGRLQGLGTWWGYTTGAAVNQGGIVAGSAVQEQQAENGNAHAAVLRDDEWVDLGTLGGDVSLAVAINQSGQVAGTSTNWNGEWRAFLYKQGVMKDLGSLGGGYSDARSMNDKGQVVGLSFLDSTYYHGFLYTNGKMVDLTPEVGGGVDSQGMAINGLGDVAGSVGEGGPLGAAPRNMFIRHAGTTTVLGRIDLGGDTRCWPHAINNARHIVGTCDDTISYAQVAVLWNGQALIDINRLLRQGSGWTVTDAVAIDQSDRVLAVATGPDQQVHAVMLRLVD